MSAYVSIRQHASAYGSIRQHTSADVSIRQHTSACMYRQVYMYSCACSLASNPIDLCTVMTYQYSHHAGMTALVWALFFLSFLSFFCCPPKCFCLPIHFYKGSIKALLRRFKGAIKALLRVCPGGAFVEPTRLKLFSPKSYPFFLPPNTILLRLY